MDEQKSNVQDTETTDAVASSEQQETETPADAVSESPADAVSESSADAVNEDSSLPEVTQTDVEEIEEEEEFEPYVPKLNPGQQKFWQIFAGWGFGFAIWFSLGISSYFPDDFLLSWLWVIIFAVAMFGRRSIENKTGIKLVFFIKHFLIALIVFLALFVLLGPVGNVLPMPVL